jgi:hypothetical protein
MLPAALFAQGAYSLGVRHFGDSKFQGYGPYREAYSDSANTEVQVLLTRLGYYHGRIDGNVSPGSPTAVAITLYQRAHNLPVTGAIDGGLIASLNGQ